MNITIPDAMHDWVQKKIVSGKYASVGDYMHDLIKRDQAEEDRLQALVEALIEGEESGISERDVSDILAALGEEANSQV